jgi:hypothetical protein
MSRRELASLHPAIHVPAQTNMAPDHRLALLFELIRRARLIMPPRAAWKRLSGKRQRASAGLTTSIAKITASAGICGLASTRHRRGTVNMCGREELGRIGGLGISTGGEFSDGIAAAGDDRVEYDGL